YPDSLDCTLYRHNGRKYVTVKPKEGGRYAVPEVEMELGLLDGWVRYWYKGRLLPLPGELQRELNEAKQQAEHERRRADQLQQFVEQEQAARRTAEEEVARLRAQLAALRSKRTNGS